MKGGVHGVQRNDVEGVPSASVVNISVEAEPETEQDRYEQERAAAERAERAAAEREREAAQERAAAEAAEAAHKKAVEEYEPLPGVRIGPACSIM
jgi:hypothetical protein